MNTIEDIKNTAEAILACYNARADGSAVKIVCRPKRSNLDWTPVKVGPTEWNLDIYDFKVFDPNATELHNPSGVKESQIPPGRKLLTLEDIKRAADNPHAHKRLHTNIWAWLISRNDWDRSGRYAGSSFSTTYCVPTNWQDPLLKKTVRKKCGPEHFPNGTVVRYRDNENTACFSSIAARDETGIVATSGFLSYEKLMREDRVVRSLDNGVTWLPCYVEEEE